jgi:hypothetical protein
MVEVDTMECFNGFFYCISHIHTRAVWKVSANFEYLKNQLCDLDVTWPPVRGDLAVHLNSHSPVGLVSRQWDADDWAFVPYDHRMHKSPPFQWWFYLWEKPEVTRSQIWAVGGFTDLGDVMLCHKSLHESCRIGRHIVVMTLICLLGYFECNGHTVQKLRQRHLTADWLAPWDSECSWMQGKVSSDWLPSYMKAMWPVLKIFKMDGNLLDILHIW